MSILFSVMIFQSQFTFMQWCGSLLVVGSIRARGNICCIVFDNTR